MNKKKTFNSFSSFVYSTNPDFEPEAEEKAPLEEFKPAEQQLRIWLETKHRGGKTVSVVSGFEGGADALETLGKQLKQACGTGGSVKDGEIIIQGDHRDKILQYLTKQGFSKTKKAGG
jgi:translation initiation factor 1